MFEREVWDAVLPAAMEALTDLVGLPNPKFPHPHHNPQPHPNPNGIGAGVPNTEIRNRRFHLCDFRLDLQGTGATR